GWESCANTAATICGGGTFKGGGGNATTPVRMMAFSRYFNIIGNVIGTPGIATSGYTTTTAIFQDNYAYSLGGGSGPQPNDPVSATSTYRWGNVDPFT